MNHQLTTEHGMTLQVLQTDKFKTFSISLRFSSAFLPEEVNARAILPDVLLGGTKHSPSREQLQLRMDALYGLSISSGTDKIGRQSVIWFEMKSVNETYLPEKTSTIAEALDLLHEIIFEPKMIKNQFRKKTVEEEKRMLKEDFEAEYADKTDYSYARFTSLMFENELAKYRAKGIYETLDSLSEKMVTDAYFSVLANDSVTFSATGDFRFDTIRDLIFSRFRFASPKSFENWVDQESKVIPEPTIHHEYSELNQARVNIGYRLCVRFGDPDYYAAALLNAVFGEFDHSKLFQVVREKNTLCYYINSSYDSNKGVITVFAGIDPRNEEQTLSLIDSVWKSIQNGEVTEEELFLAKESLSKRIRQNADSPERLANLYFLYQQTLHRPYDPVASLQTIQSVRIEDLTRISRSMVLDTTYLLTKKAV